jgi:hypothetical protein
VTQSAPGGRHPRRCRFQASGYPNFHGELGNHSASTRILLTGNPGLGCRDSPSQPEITAGLYRGGDRGRTTLERERGRLRETRHRDAGGIAGGKTSLTLNETSLLLLHVVVRDRSEEDLGRPAVVFVHKDSDLSLCTADCEVEER